jgi:hypothetical protein
VSTKFKPKAIGKLDRLDINRPESYTLAEVDRQAHQCDPWECVIANAINRTPGHSRAQVGAQYVYFHRGNVPMRGELSPNARAMIRAYDKDNQIMPAGIVIELIPPGRKVGTKKPRGPHSTKRKPEHKTRIRQSTPSTRNIYVRPPHDSDG